MNDIKQNFAFKPENPKTKQIPWLNNLIKCTAHGYVLYNNEICSFHIKLSSTL